MADTPPRELAQLPQLVAIATTEQYVLAGTRSTTLADATQRSAMFFTSVSSTLIALAFVAQVSRMGSTFFLFACVMLSTLCIVGVLTYVRAIQQSTEDMLLIHGINRIRHWYAEVAPELEPYFVASTHDDYPGLLADMGWKTSGMQSWLTTACTIALVNCVLAGALAGISVTFAVHVQVGVAMIAAAMGFVIALFVHTRVSESLWRENGARYRARFPSRKGSDIPEPTRDTG
jgi:hypothetical protein